MKSIACALFVALSIQLAFGAPTTSEHNRTMPDTVMMGQTVSVGDLDQFVVIFGVSPCMASCMREMRKGFNSTDNDGDHHLKFEAVCDNYLAAAECFRKCPDGDDHLFDVISSGANFMCVEQRAAFERAMPCIRENKKAMKEECRQKCGLKEEASQLMEEESDDTTDIPPQWNNSSALFAHVGDLCDVLHCSIECGRDLLNERCDHDQHVGNLLTEVIIRPLEKNAEFLKEMSPDVEEAINEALPKSCHFIIDMKELNALRAGWVAPDVHGNAITEEPKFTTVSPNLLAGGNRLGVDSQQRIARRRRSASSLLAPSGVFASNAMAYFA